MSCKCKRNDESALISEIAEQIKKSAEHWRCGEVNIHQTAWYIFNMCREYNKKEFKRKLKNKKRCQ